MPVMNMMMPVSRPSIVIIPNLRARVRKSMYGIPAMSGMIPQMAAMRMGMNPRHATANTTMKYIAVKMPTLMRSFPVSLPPVFDVEADAFPVVFMCESFPVRLFSRRAFYEVSHIQQQSILANTHRAATPNSRACSKRPHVLQDGRVRFTTARARPWRAAVCPAARPRGPACARTRRGRRSGRTRSRPPA